MDARWAEFAQAIWMPALGLLVVALYALGDRALARRGGRFRLPWFPLGLAFLLFGALALFGGLSVHPEPGAWHRWTESAITILTVCLAIRLVLGVVEATTRWWSGTSMPGITRSLLLLLAYGTVAIVVLSSEQRVNFTGLLTTSALLTAIVGFAAQATLSNLLSGVMLQMEGIVKPGGWRPTSGRERATPRPAPPPFWGGSGPFLGCRRPKGVRL